MLYHLADQRLGNTGQEYAFFLVAHFKISFCCWKRKSKQKFFFILEASKTSECISLQPKLHNNFIAEQFFGNRKKRTIRSRFFL